MQKGFIAFHNSRDDYREILLATLVFIFVPILGILFLLASNINSCRVNRAKIYSLFLLIATYLGAINSTKIPISDQWKYMMAYKEVPQMGFLKSLTNIYGSDFTVIHDQSMKELGFGLLNYIGYYISFGNYPFFVFLFTIFLYLLLFHSIYIYYINGYEDANNKILSGVISIAFFTQFFNLTIHLQRQEIASVVMVLALIIYIVKGKRLWLLIFGACTLHTSVAIFLPLFILGEIIYKLSKLGLLCFIMGFAALFLFLNLVGLYLIESIGDIYLFDRMAAAGSSEENKMALSLVLVLSVPMLFLSIKKLFFTENHLYKRERLLYLAYTVIIVLVFFIPDNTMQYRFYMLSYTFIPFFFPQFLYKLYDKNICKYFNIIISTFLFFRFFLTFEDIPYEFAPIETILTSNFLELLMWRM